jgi:caffeoyl-CoA O-methyltransferase
MVESVARVATEQPGRYIKQIVSHLGNRRSTRLADDGTGVVVFEGGQCTLTAESGILILAASGADAGALQHVRDVLSRHLERFGAREGLRVTWSQPG